MWALAGGALGGYLLGKSGGSGSGGSPSSTSVTTSNIAPWAQPGVQSLIQSGLADVYPNYDPTTGNLGNQSGYTPFNANATDPMTQQALTAAQSTTAGFNPLQQQSFNAAANMQMPGQYNSATGLNNQAGYGALGTTGQANMYGQMGAMAGNSYGMNAQNPNAVANYMNPYLQNTLAPAYAATEPTVRYATGAKSRCANSSRCIWWKSWHATKFFESTKSNVGAESIGQGKHITKRITPLIPTCKARKSWYARRTSRFGGC